jgi:signal-transduction protein with cAMP-binding, CBS, and nucleotidyltransferase domain
MKAEDVGSLVILEDGSPVGIVTEKDFVDKVVSVNKQASKIKVKQVMSSPLISIAPNEKVQDAAKKMSSMKLHRLPVVRDGRLIGILTENDILKLSPGLIELTREWSKIGTCGPMGVSSTVSSGYCERCNAYSAELIVYEGQMLCADCYEQVHEG